MRNYHATSTFYFEVILSCGAFWSCKTISHEMRSVFQFSALIVIVKIDRATFNIDIDVQY